MRYKIVKLDRRHSYNNLFEYFVRFSDFITDEDLGPIDFNNVLQWFQSTWGWSAEIRNYVQIKRWFKFNGNIAHANCCSAHWSWSNGVDRELRIYVRGAEELNFFQLKFSIDQ